MVTLSNLRNLYAWRRARHQAELGLLSAVTVSLSLWA
jgi:hypothetical protein